MFSNLASLSVLPGSFRLPFLPLKRHPDDRLLPAAYEFAWDTQHSLYDCFYLAFAEAVDGRLITADRKFYKALAGSVLHERLVWVEDLGSETSSRILQSQGREASYGWSTDPPALTRVWKSGCQKRAAGSVINVGQAEAGSGTVVGNLYVISRLPHGACFKFQREPLFVVRSLFGNGEQGKAAMAMTDRRMRALTQSAAP